MKKNNIMGFNKIIALSLASYLLLATLVSFYVTRGINGEIIIGAKSIVDDGITYAFKSFEIRYGSSEETLSNANRLIMDWWSRDPYVNAVEVTSFLDNYSQTGSSLYAHRIIYPLLVALILSFANFYALMIPIVICFLIIWIILIKEILTNKTYFGVIVIFLLYSSNYFLNTVLSLQGADIILITLILIYYKIITSGNRTNSRVFYLTIIAAIGSLTKPSLHFWLIFSFLEVIRICSSNEQNKFKKIISALIPAYIAFSIFYISLKLTNPFGVIDQNNLYKIVLLKDGISTSLYSSIKLFFLDFITLSTKEVPLFILLVWALIIAYINLNNGVGFRENWSSIYLLGIIFASFINSLIVGDFDSGLRYWMPLFPILSYYLITTERQYRNILKANHIFRTD